MSFSRPMSYGWSDDLIYTGVGKWWKRKRIEIAVFRVLKIMESRTSCRFRYIAIAYVTSSLFKSLVLNLLSGGLHRDHGDFFEHVTVRYFEADYRYIFAVHIYMDSLLNVRGISVLTIYVFQSIHR